jgi:hypothetical protein
MSATTTLVLLAAVASAGQPTTAKARFGEACTGTEVIQWGSQPPKTVPYRLTFYVDLARRSYCYAACEADQTYAISDQTSKPIKLSDFDLPKQVRHLTFDPATSSVNDFQVIDAGVVKVTRRASGACSPATLHEPLGPPQPGAGS